jgi:hypothetical protein
MTSLNLRADIYDPKTLAAMDQAFAAVWRMLRADDHFRDYASDAELKMAIGKRLLNLVVAEGDGSSPASKSHCAKPAFATPLRRVVLLRTQATRESKP